MTSRRSSLSQFFMGKKTEVSEEKGDQADHLQMTAAATNNATDPPSPDSQLPVIEEQNEEHEEEKGSEENPAMNEKAQDERAGGDSDDDDPLPSGELPPIITFIPNPTPPPTLEYKKSTNSDLSSVASASVNSGSSNPPPPPVAEVVTPVNFIKPTVTIPPLKPANEEKKSTPTQKVVPEKDLVHNLQQDLKLCEKLASEDRIGEAYFLLNNIEKFLCTLSPTAQEQVQRGIDASPRIKTLRKDSQELQTWLDIVDDKSVWNAWNTSMGPQQDVSVYTHRDEKDGEYFFKIEGHLHCSMIEAVATVLENDLHHLWMPMCTSSEVLHVANTFQRIVRTNVDFVLLKKTAATAIRGDVLPDGRVLLSMKPVEDKKENKGFFPKDPKQRMDLSGCILLTEEVVNVHDRVDEMMTLMAASKDSVMRDGAKASPANSLTRTPRGNSMRMSAAEIYNLKVDDIYGSGLDGNREAGFALNSGARKISPQRRRSSVGSWHDSPSKAATTTAIKVQLVLRADLLIDFIPDWIFNLAVRSSISMLVPMMDHQATFFKDQGHYHQRMVDQQGLYEELERRINSYKKKTS